MSQNTSCGIPFSECRVYALREYAADIVNWQLDHVERCMKARPDEYPDYADGLARLDDAAETLARTLKDSKLEDEIMDAHCEVCAALATEMYTRGVLDGGRVYHAFITRGTAHTRITP